MNITELTIAKHTKRKPPHSLIEAINNIAFDCLRIECVNDVCICVPERLPTVHVSYRIDPPNVILFWNVSTNYSLPFGVSIEKVAIR